MIGPKIKDYMQANKIPFSQVANATGVAASTFSLMINGRRRITAEEYFLICSALKVDLNKFAND